MAHPALATMLALGKKYVIPMVANKITREVVKKVSNEGIESETKEIEVYYEGISKKKSAIWVALSVASITVAQSMGLIDSNVAQALLDLLNNEAFQDAVNTAVESSE